MIDIVYTPLGMGIIWAAACACLIMMVGRKRR